MTDNQKLAVVAIGVLTSISLLVGNILVMSRLGNIENKIEDNAEKIDRIEKEVDSIKSVVYDSGVKISLDDRERNCLAKNIYHEAGVESFEGKIAVAQVTLNRLETGRWGDSICDVVYARKQFSWTLDKKKKMEKPRGSLWRESVRAKDAFLAGLRIKNLEQSKHYHADYVNPRWSKQKVVATKVGQHIFYEN